MPKLARFAVLIVGIVVAGAALWWWLGRHQSPTELRLYGNVDLRQVELPFNGSERIVAVLAQEGDHVKQGQLLARLDTSRLAPQVAKAEADLAAQMQSVDRLHHGNRPEEIAQARANLDAAAADAENARAQFARFRSLSDISSGRAVSRQDMDSAKPCNCMMFERSRPRSPTSAPFSTLCTKSRMRWQPIVPISGGASGWMPRSSRTGTH
jgi:HlyD family secretion protein